MSHWRIIHARNAVSGCCFIPAADIVPNGFFSLSGPHISNLGRVGEKHILDSVPARFIFMGVPLNDIGTDPKGMFAVRDWQPGEGERRRWKG